LIYYFGIEKQEKYLNRKEMKYNIYDIFYSIQGEGHHAGMPAIFIRFSGCNLNCSFCDEIARYENGVNLDLKDIYNKLIIYKQCKTLILTGGEPALQIDRDFIDYFKKFNYIIHIETNGSIKLPDNIDWITVSPKSEDCINGDEIKIVYTGQNIKIYEKKLFKYFYLQPVSNNNLNECIEYVKSNPKWRLSVQLHKLLNFK